MKIKISFKYITVFLFFICLFFTSCENSPDYEIYKIHKTQAIALNEDGGNLLFYTLNGINSTLVSIDTRNAELTASDGTTIVADDFKTGQLVSITYNGMIATSYPGQMSCYSIRVIGEADENETEKALIKYVSVHTGDYTIFYIDELNELAKKTVMVTYGDIFGEWKKLNSVPDEVTLLKMTFEDNAYEEANGDVMVYHAATVRDFYLDLSVEFLSYLASTENESMIIESLVKTIIGDNPSAQDTAVFLTVNGNALITENNDFSGRLN